MDITISGGGNLKKFVKSLQEQTQNVKLEVGFLDSENASKAAKNEYGGVFPVDDDYRARAEKKGISLGDYIGIPPRPFMQDTVKEKGKSWVKLLSEELPDQDYHIKRSLGILGTQMVSDIKDTITNADFIENSEQTAAIKGFNRPLVDSGDMLDAVTYEIKS